MEDNNMTETEAEEIIDRFTGTHRLLAIAQYHLSRQDGKSVNQSVDDACAKVREVCDEILGPQKLAK
jgi:hypothetical protein